MAMRRRIGYGAASLAVIALCAVSYYVNNPYFPELAGKWTVAAMKNVPFQLRFSVSENVHFDIDPRGLLGNKDTPFTMMIIPAHCGSGCYYVYDNFNPIRPGWLYRLERGPSPDQLYLHPTDDSVITLQRLPR
ncbi:MAG: hypothetical protein AB7T18_00340 [Alphaproteobacteria bacterium]